MGSPFPDDHLRHLRQALEGALESTPFYSRWRAHDPGPEQDVVQRIRGLPTLTRRELRAQFPKGFTPGGKDLKAALDSGEVELVATSGTTDDRVQVIWWQPWWDRQEEAQYLDGNPLTRQVWSGRFKECVLTTPVCSAGVCHIGDLKMEERIYQRMLFLNQKSDPIHWTDSDLIRMTEELGAYRPDALEADPAYLAALSRFARARGLALHQPRYIGLTYELISRCHLRAIRAAFPSVPIINSYGSTEGGCLHMSCEHGRLHANLGWTHVDLVPLDPPDDRPDLGRLCLTVLQNPWLKLLRYETGDLATLARDPCPCGRGGESLLRIEGRMKDLTYGVDGRRVTVEQVDAAIGDLSGLEGYQVIQESEDAYLARYIPKPEADGALAKEIGRRLAELYSGGAIRTRRETTLAPEPSGKFRLARCDDPRRAMRG